MGKRKIPDKTRLWCFTQFVIDFDFENALANRQVKYLCFGKEKCPTTGRAHWQGFVYFHNQVGSLKHVKQILPGANVRKCAGTMEENEAYCSKDGFYTELGERPKQGYRTDLEEVKARIFDGETSADQICCDDPAFYHQYGRTITKLEDIALRKKFRKWMTTGVWFTGPTGSGKSHAAFEDYDPKTHYVKPLADHWWDGYAGQEIVILNEFSGQIPFSELMDLVDKWPAFVKRRGREPVPFLAKEVRIASINPPGDIMFEKNAWAPLRGLDEFNRRFRVVNLKKRNFGSEVL